MFAKTTTRLELKKILNVCYAKMVNLKMKAKVFDRRKNLYILCEDYVLAEWFESGVVVDA